jgi:hypothetical protein
MPPSDENGAGFASIYAVNLLYVSVPSIDPLAILAGLSRRCGNVRRFGALRDSSFVLLDHTAARMPVQCSVTAHEGGFDPSHHEAERQQTWDWRDAPAALDRARASVTVSDLLASDLPPAHRIQLFERVVAAVLEVAPALCIAWTPSQRLVEPRRFLQTLETDPLHAAMNVRYFDLRDRPEGEHLMDTLGLAALGYPDLQVHFRRLPPRQMAAFLSGAGQYHCQGEGAIVDGDTVPGPTGDSWTCRLEPSLLPPRRNVIDIQPSPIFSARPALDR